MSLEAEDAKADLEEIFDRRTIDSEYIKGMLEAIIAEADDYGINMVVILQDALSTLLEK